MTFPAALVSHTRRLAAGLALGATLALGGCALMLAETLPDVSRRDPGFFALPVRAMLTRESIEPRVLIACDRSECGHDVMVAIVSAKGAEAATLRRDFSDFAMLRQRIERRAPDDPKLRAKFGLPKVVPGYAQVEKAEVMGRRAVRITLSGGPKDRVAHGIVVERTTANAAQPEFILAISDSLEAAEGYAGAALQAQ